MGKIRSAPGSLFERVRGILTSARTHAARSVNTAQVMANWWIGREIVNEQQRGLERAAYGQHVLAELAVSLRKEFGNGYSVDNLELFRRFYVQYPGMISDALRRKSWKPGVLHPDLSWTHYRTLLRVEKTEVRSFYEIEAVRNAWSARGLERQINSSLYERLALSRDKKGVMRLAMKGQDVQNPSDVIKDPVVMEFLGLPESSRLAESNLETAILTKLEAFLLELGKGFAFVARQKRLTLDGDHFYVDLVFFHSILKCHVLIDLKVGKLTHADLGQMQLYVNYFDQECRSKGDGPTLGLILCADKNEAMVKYTLGPDQRKTIFASRYRLHLPSEAELRQEIQREVRAIGTPSRNRRHEPRDP